MNILLTGASGYLGQHLLLALLEAGHMVTAVVRNRERLGELGVRAGVRVLEGDLADEERVAEAVQGQAVVLHAALIWGAPGSELPLPDAIAAAKLFDAAGSAGVGRCVLVSSTAVHRPFAGVMCETDPIRTADMYGATKATAELMLWAACGTHGMRGVVARMGPIVGPPAVAGGPFRTDDTLRRLVQAAKAGEPLRVVAEAGRQFMGASDAARTLAQMVWDPHAEGTTLCVASEVTLWQHIAEEVIAMTGSSSTLQVLPAPAGDSPPRFAVDRLTALLGGTLDSESALSAHLRHLVQHG